MSERSERGDQRVAGKLVPGEGSIESKTTSPPLRRGTAENFPLF